jgi:signal transduction histidine kinase
VRLSPIERWSFEARIAAGVLLITAAAGAAIVASARGPVAPVLIVAAAALAAAAAAALLTRRTSDPIARLSAAARRWGRGDLAYREEAPAPPALDRLREALNEMAGALRARDDSMRARAHDRIMEAEKLATIGQLAAGVAHEINNPLAAILLYGDLLLENTATDDPRRPNMERIVKQAARAREIVQGLLEFAHQTPSQARRMDLNETVTDALELLARHPAAQNVEVRSELSSVPLWIRADESKIQQVLINIIVNAFEAMASGGTLTVRTGLSERAGFCRVAISDSGPGILEEHMGRLFEPFFTTKEAGHGVGLGLAISYGIIQQHGGRIEAQSTPGSGATFRVLLPTDPGEA